MKLPRPSIAPLRTILAPCRLPLFPILLLILSCNTTTSQLIHSATAEPADFSLSNTRPETFPFEIPKEAAGPFSFAIELTYFPNQLQDWDALPLYYTLQHPDGKEEDKRFTLNLKDDKGDWRGELQANGNDKAFEEIIQKDLALPPGKYELKLFGDSKDLAKPILGIVKVAFKVYM
jgi:hypothetical protein